MKKKGKKTKYTAESRIERLLYFTDKDRVGIIGAFIIIATLAYLRSIGESSLFEYPATSLYMRAVHESLYFALFMTGAFLVTAVSGVSGRKIFNVMLFGWWIIVLPPIIDFFLGYGPNHGAGGYPYPKNPNPITQIINFFSVDYIKKIGVGEIFHLYLVTILPGVYVALKKKSVFRGILSSVVIFLFIVYITVAMNFIKGINYEEGYANVVLFGGIISQPIYAEYYTGLSTTYASFLILQQIFLFIVLYYTTMFLTSSFLFMYVYTKERTIAFIKSIRWKRLGAVSILTLMGFMIPRTMLYFGMIRYVPIYPEYVLHFAYVGIAMISTIFAAQSWNMMEDLNTMDKWKFPYTRKQYRNLAIAFIILSLSMSYLLGYGVFILDVLFIFLSIVYSCKPFEGFKTKLRYFILSMYGLIPFLMAYYTPTYWLIKVWGPHYRVYDPSMLKVVKVPVIHPLYNIIIYSIILIYAISLLYLRHIHSKDNEA